MQYVTGRVAMPLILLLAALLISSAQQQQQQQQPQQPPPATAASPLPSPVKEAAKSPARAALESNRETGKARVKKGKDLLKSFLDDIKAKEDNAIKEMKKAKTPKRHKACQDYLAYLTQFRTPNKKFLEDQIATQVAYLDSLDAIEASLVDSENKQADVKENNAKLEEENHKKDEDRKEDNSRDMEQYAHDMTRAVAQEKAEEEDTKAQELADPNKKAEAYSKQMETQQRQLHEQHLTSMKEMQNLFSTENQKLKEGNDELRAKFKQMQVSQNQKMYELADALNFNAKEAAEQETKLQAARLQHQQLLQAVSSAQFLPSLPGSAVSPAGTETLSVVEKKVPTPVYHGAAISAAIAAAKAKGSEEVLTLKPLSTEAGPPQSELVVAPQSDKPVIAPASPPVPSTQLAAVVPPPWTPMAQEAPSLATLKEPFADIPAPPPALTNPQPQLAAADTGMQRIPLNQASMAPGLLTVMSAPTQPLQMLSTSNTANQAAPLPDAFTKWRQAALYQEQFV